MYENIIMTIKAAYSPVMAARGLYQVPRPPIRGQQVNQMKSLFVVWSTHVNWII